MEATTLPPLVASLSQRPREPGKVKMMPPPRSSPITVDLPSTMYRPNSGPPLAPISLLPVQDTTGYITDRRLMPSPGLAKDGRPLPPILTYIVRWTDAPAARNLVPVKEILDYVSPAAVEEFERKFEAELDNQRARKVAEKEEGQRLEAAAVTAGAPEPVPQGQKGQKKRGRPPKHKANDIAPITAETEEEDVSHKKFRPGSMSLSTPKKSRAMTIPLNEEMGDGTETPVEYMDEYDELAGEQVNYLDDMEIFEDRQASPNTMTFRESAVTAPDRPGTIEDDDESDSDDENYLGREDRKPESMSYDHTPLYDSEDEIMISIEGPDHGVGRMNIDEKIATRESSSPESSPVTPDREESEKMWPDDEDSGQSVGSSEQADDFGQQVMPERTPTQHLTRKQPLEEAVNENRKLDERISPDDEKISPDDERISPDDEKISPDDERISSDDETTSLEDERISSDDERNSDEDKRISPDKRDPTTELVNLPGHKPMMSNTPIPLPVIPGLKKPVPKQTPVPLPFLPGMHRSAASSTATTPVQPPSRGLMGYPQAKPASCAKLPSLRPPSFSSQRSELHRWITETPVYPPAVPKSTGIQRERQQPSWEALGFRGYGASKMLGTFNGNVRIQNTGSNMTASSMHTSANVSSTTDVGKNEEMVNVFGDEGSFATLPGPPSSTAGSAPRKRKRQSMRGLGPIEKDEAGDEFWEVRVIIDHKDEFNEDEELLGRQYLVVWEGDWPLNWESEENFVDQAPITQYWNRRIDKKRALFKRYRPKGRMRGTTSRFYGEKVVKNETVVDRSESHSEVRSTRGQSIEDDDTPEKRRRRRSSRMTKALRLDFGDDDVKDELDRAGDVEADDASVDVEDEEVDEEAAEEDQQPSPAVEAAPTASLTREPVGTGHRAVNAIKARLGWPFGLTSG